MRRIDWTAAAIVDLDRLEFFLYSKNPLAAARATEAIYLATRILADFPETGRPYRDSYRELPVRFSNSGYLVLYRSYEDRIEIVRVRHQREADY